MERIEVAIKGMTANRFTLIYGVFGYNDTNNFAMPTDTERHTEMLDFIHTATARSKDGFVIRCHLATGGMPMPAMRGNVSRAMGRESYSPKAFV